MNAFLEKWAKVEIFQLPELKRALHTASPGVMKETMPNAAAASPAATEREQEPDLERQSVEWAEWKAAALNRLFQEQGITGLAGGITQATVRHGERDKDKG